MTNEIGDAAISFTRQIRSACAKTGKDQGYFYRKTERYVSKACAELALRGKKEIKAMIEEVLSERESEDDSNDAEAA